VRSNLFTLPILLTCLAGGSLSAQDFRLGVQGGLLSFPRAICPIPRTWASRSAGTPGGTSAAATGSWPGPT